MLYTGAGHRAHRAQGVCHVLVCVEGMHFPRRVCALLFLGLVRTHSSDMTTAGSKGHSSKRGAQRRGQLRGDGGAPAGEASRAERRGRRSAVDSR